MVDFTSLVVFLFGGLRSSVETALSIVVPFSLVVVFRGTSLTLLSTEAITSGREGFRLCGGGLMVDMFLLQPVPELSLLSATDFPVVTE